MTHPSTWPAWSFPLPWRDPAEAFAGVQAQPYAQFFDGAYAEPPRSLILFDPDATLESFGETLIVTRGAAREERRGNPFGILREMLKDLPRSGADFAGLAAGYFGYELAGQIEAISTPLPGTLPDLALGFYTRAFIFDHAARTVIFHTYAPDHKTAEAQRDAAIAQLATDAPPQTVPQISPDWRSNFTEADYQSAICTIMYYILAGDIYQTNLSQRFTAALPAGFDPFAHYLSLRAVNHAPYAAYLNFGSGRIVASASPEQFLRVRGRTVTTRPIKGTRPRGADTAHDTALAADLATSEKDRAENIMIVDLLRNDLSRVCTDNSIAVQGLCTVESFARVHHLVSTITGTLRPGKTALDALIACFPGGSITGAPKIRAMEIIAALEKTRRGPYCGAIGWLDAHGDAELSIAIRTLVYDGGTVSLNAGGGITAASDPAAEYQETLDKAAGIFESFRA